eukprot:5043839-Amphidinium_carterae.1
MVLARCEAWQRHSSGRSVSMMPKFFPTVCLPMEDFQTLTTMRTQETNGAQIKNLTKAQTCFFELAGNWNSFGEALGATGIDRSVPRTVCGAQ